tara:strand:+ start:5522 stop:6790 length:1269 start_codon:yes stop_codon:yes gene_type:complete
MKLKLENNGLKKLENSGVILPFSSVQLDKPTMLKTFAERSINTSAVIDNFGCLVINLSEISETIRIWNNYRNELEPFFADKLIVSDPCSEITFYAWGENRKDYLQEAIHPVFKQILTEANTKNYSSIWLDAFEEKSDIINFVEKTIDKQSILSAALPITPVLETSSPNALIKLSHEINDEACAISQNLEKDYFGCYFSLHGSLLGSDERAGIKLNTIMTKIIDILKKHDNVLLYLKFIDVESTDSHAIEKMYNLTKMIDAITRLRGTEHINGHNFLFLVGGMTKKFMVVIGKGADSAVELMNGKSSIVKPGGFNIKNRSENFQFGDFYDMNNQVMISYDAAMEYYKKHKVLPSYTEAAKTVTKEELKSHIKYARIKRLNQIEARCLEVEQFRKDIITGQERGLQDRLSRSTDAELQQLATLF